MIQFSLTSGNVDDDTEFAYDTDTEVDASCAATLNGEFWVIGGNIKRRQVKILRINSPMKSNIIF